MVTYDTFKEDILKCVVNERYYNRSMLGEKDNRVTRSHLLIVSRNLRSGQLLMKETHQDVSIHLEKVLNEMIDAGTLCKASELAPVYDLTDDYKWKVEEENPRHH